MKKSFKKNDKKFGAFENFYTKLRNFTSES